MSNITNSTNKSFEEILADQIPIFTTYETLKNNSDTWQQTNHQKVQDLEARRSTPQGLYESAHNARLVASGLGAVAVLSAFSAYANLDINPGLSATSGLLAAVNGGFAIYDALNSVADANRAAAMEAAEHSHPAGE